jgi:hypothetical protein
MLDGIPISRKINVKISKEPSESRLQSRCLSAFSYRPCEQAHSYHGLFQQFGLKSLSFDKYRMSDMIDTRFKVQSITRSIFKGRMNDLVSVSG